MHVLILETGDIRPLTLNITGTDHDIVVYFIERIGGFYTNDFISFDNLMDEYKERYELVGNDYPYVYQSTYDWWLNLTKMASKGGEEAVDGIIEALNNCAVKEEIRVCREEGGDHDHKGALQIIKRFLGSISQEVFTYTYTHDYRETTDANTGLIGIKIEGLFYINIRCSESIPLNVTAKCTCDFEGVEVSEVELFPSDIECDQNLSEKQSLQLLRLLKNIAERAVKLNTDQVLEGKQNHPSLSGDE